MLRPDDFELMNYWPPFLQMLSVERVGPYVEELGLPFGECEFPNVMRLARASLESEMFCAIGPARQSPERAHFLRAWDSYRSRSSVLDEKTLTGFCASKEPYRITYTVFVELGNWIGEELLIDLQKWFTENYPRYLDDTWLWPRAVKTLLGWETSETPYKDPPPLTAEEIGQARLFVERYEDRSNDLERRMFTARAAAERDPPTPWELVLQRFSVDNEEGNDHPWMGTVAACLRVRLIRREWTNLSATLGPDLMGELVGWIRAQAASLPNARPLPDPPRLL